MRICPMKITLLTKNKTLLLKKGEIIISDIFIQINLVVLHCTNTFNYCQLIRVNRWDREFDIFVRIWYRLVQKIRRYGLDLRFSSRITLWFISVVAFIYWSLLTHSVVLYIMGSLMETYLRLMFPPTDYIFTYV